ncbi:squalene/phytoene synthase family protein [Streptomyces sp. NPDC001410]|uniref:squalene/phytoene synthase family protein n=1 Tax=Streptomyces sp. NPDC001410 TaxID=3364574 RepID=UPI0036BCF558
MSAVLAEADRIVDEGPPADRERSFARWRAETMAEVRSGRSEHPLRRAFVDTMRRWDLDVAVLEECLETLHADAAGPLAFAEFEDLRRYLRGASGPPSS